MIGKERKYGASYVAKGSPQMHNKKVLSIVVEIYGPFCLDGLRCKLRFGSQVAARPKRSRKDKTLYSFFSVLARTLVQKHACH